MWKIARISREKHQKAWKQDIRREHKSIHYNVIHMYFFAGSFPRPTLAIFTGTWWGDDILFASPDPNPGAYVPM